MNSDIRIAVSFKGHRKRKKLTRLLGHRGVCCLIDLWLGAAMSNPSGALTGWDSEDIANEGGWSGDPEKFVSALVDCRFLERDEAGTYKLHDWADHQGYVVHADQRKERAKRAAAVKYGKKVGEYDYINPRSQRLAEARKKGSHSEQEWFALVSMLGNVCLSCGTAEDIVKDHITPVYQGGSDGIENLQPLCRSCNSSKGSDCDDLRKKIKPEINWSDKQCISSALAVHSSSYVTPPSPAPSPTPVPDPPPLGIKRKEAFNAVAFRPMFFPEKLWAAYLANRTFKKLQNSELALTTACAEFVKALESGYSIEECVGAFVEGKWTRFKVEWLENQRARAGNRQQPMTQKQKDARELLEGNFT